MLFDYLPHFLNPMYVTPYFVNKMIDMEHISIERQEKKSEVNRLFTLKKEECDGFTPQSKIYRCLGSIDEIDGVFVDSYIMKEEGEDDTSTKFTLTKNDCRNLKIDFQKGLQLFPKNLNWVEVNDTVENEPIRRDRDFLFDPEDLSTYPCDFETGRIKKMTVKVSGCQRNREGHIQHLSIRGAHKIPLNCSLRFFYSECEGREEKIVRYNLVPWEQSVYLKNSSVLCELDFMGSGINIEPKSLKNKSLQDFINVYI